MPEWLKVLLAQQGSVGMVDTLAQLVGQMPEYQKLKTNRRINERGQTVEVTGTASINDKGIPVISLAPNVLAKYGSKLPEGYGYGQTQADSTVRFGDAVVQHEFGHLAPFAGTSPSMTAGIFQAFPDAETSEKYADSFQNAFQFLRSGRTDIEKLDPKCQILAKAILSHPLYQNHPLNQRQGVQGFIKGVMQQ